MPESMSAPEAAQVRRAKEQFLCIIIPPRDGDLAAACGLPSDPGAAVVFRPGDERQIVQALRDLRILEQVRAVQGQDGKTRPVSGKHKNKYGGPRYFMEATWHRIAGPNCEMRFAHVFRWSGNGYTHDATVEACVGRCAPGRRCYCIERPSPINSRIPELDCEERAHH